MVEFSWSHTRFQIGYFPFEIVDCTQVSMKMPRTDDLFVCTCACDIDGRVQDAIHTPNCALVVCFFSLSHFAHHLEIPHNCPTILFTANRHRISFMTTITHTHRVCLLSWAHGIWFGCACGANLSVVSLFLLHSLASISIQFQFRANNTCTTSTTNNNCNFMQIELITTNLQKPSMTFSST